MAIKSFYQQFDRDLQRLVECFPGAEIIFVSDHGTTLRRYSVNLNRFLQQRGYQKGSQKKGLFYQLATNLRHWVPQGVRQRLKAKGRISNVYAGMAPFDIRNAIAFNNTRRNEIHGIFINDENRFGGTVKSDDIRNLAYQIAEDLNSDPCAREHGISARVNESRGAPFSDQYPDIMIDLPDGYLPSNQGRDFVEPYKISGDCGNLEAMRGDEKHCIKSHRPLAVNVNHDWKARNRDKVNDLRLIYDHISAIFLNRSDSSKKI
jgi:predicted AlkP superfamily phosphohydrolase/phosphomutase